MSMESKSNVSTGNVTILKVYLKFIVSLELATLSPSSPVRFYTKPQGVYTVLMGDQLYLNCTAGGR